LVQDRSGVELHTGGILLYVEDLKRGTNKDIEPKDIFELGSNLLTQYAGKCKPLITAIRIAIMAHGHPDF